MFEQLAQMATPGNRDETHGDTKTDICVHSQPSPIMQMQPLHFLQYCGSCNRALVPEADIYIYKYVSCLCLVAIDLLSYAAFCFSLLNVMLGFNQVRLWYAVGTFQFFSNVPFMQGGLIELFLIRKLVFLYKKELLLFNKLMNSYTTLGKVAIKPKSISP